MTREPNYADLMRHDVPRARHRKVRWPIKTTPPKCEGCKQEPPACRCEPTP